MDNKKLLEELRASVGNYKPEKSKKEEKLDIEDIVEPKDKYKEDDEDLDDYMDSDEEEEEDHEEEDEEGIDLDGDGEADDIHSLHVLKTNFNASDEETQHAIASFLKMVVENDIDLETLSQFVEDLDYGDEDEEEEEEDEFGEEDNEDEFGEEDEDEDMFNDGEEEEEDEFGHKQESDMERIDRDFFTNEAVIMDSMYDVGMNDLLD